jgi:hypothetical protein
LYVTQPTLSSRDPIADFTDTMFLLLAAAPSFSSWYSHKYHSPKIAHRAEKVITNQGLKNPADRRCFKTITADVANGVIFILRSIKKKSKNAFFY